MIDRCELTLPVTMRFNCDAVAVHQHITNNTTRVPEHCGTRNWRRLCPCVGLGIVTLHEVDVTQIVPTADQVDEAIPMRDGNGVVDRYRHRRALLVVARRRVEGMDPRSRQFGSILANRVTTENVSAIARSRGHRREPAFAARYRTRFAPLLRLLIEHVR